ncbi:MAG: DUF748 domain-containing protein [Colwellia sp.]|uniref:DUF748 domain-containing protein n=1 Tax=Colwellia sp. TaxID=56799 RepID=UPI0025BF36F5|nr:DUF748 domain-containing protein [Colwellia sp.]NQZ25759.1 DUF748 domain-containing protein [Colwellia sp.]
MANLLSFFTHKIFKVLLALYLGLFFLIWLISSPIAKHFIAPILAEQQLHLSDDASIRFNPFLMRLTLSDIDVISSKNEQPESVFSLAKLELQVELWQLAFDKIVVSEFSLIQGHLKVTQDDKQLVIAGIEITDEVKAEEAAAEEIIETFVEDTQENTPYQLVLPKFLLQQFSIEIAINTGSQKSKSHLIEIEQLALNQIKANEIQQTGSFLLTALIDKTQLNLSANMELTAGKGEINSTVRLESYPIENLARYIEQLTNLKGSLSFNSQQSLTIGEQGVNFRLNNAKLTIQKMLLGLPEQNFSLKSFEYNLADLAIDLQGNSLTHLTGHSSIKLAEAIFSQKDSKATIAAFKQLELADINFTLDDEPSIDITDIILDEFLFSKKATLTDTQAKKAIDKINQRSAEDGIKIAAEDIVKLPPVLQLKQLTLNDLHIHEKSIAIENIIFDTLTGAIIIKENKDIANLISLGSQEVEQAAVEPRAVKELAAIEKKQTENLANISDQGFTFSLQALRFINDNALEFTDFSVDPIYQRTLFIDTLEVGAISNATEKQQVKTPYTLVGRSNKYANFNLTGYLQPFSAVTSFHVKGDFKEFSLPAISTYLKASTGLEVKTGQLNTALDVTLTGDELDGNVVVLLQALETGLVDSEEAGSLIDQGALPLNMAMGMLKDSDGNVELDVPLSGSTSDPKFGLSSIVTLITKKAIMSATQDYLLTTFVPYANIVSFAITAGEFALKLRFDDLDYQEKQIEPDEQQGDYLHDFIALMQDKEDTRVTICAISTPADIDLKAGVSVSDKADIKRLLELGEQREHALKDYLIEQGNIDSSRILFCKPQIDSDEGAMPRIAISV